ncbi:type 1 glutamine amidotransferase domain-containing protein [Roseisolibacter agri]|nr:type 1 glutamine amidotransferase domain-containing protein [Roseisolibacter agri]
MFDSQELDGVRIAVLAADGFEQVEVTRPVKALEKHGAEVEIVSLRPGSIQGMNLLYPGKKIDVDRTVFTADPAAYDGLHIPGGFINPDFVRQSDEALEFVRAFEAAGKPIATICHGPWVLVSAGLVRGRRLTSWPGIKDDVRNAGGVWVDSPVVHDRNWVSSRGPQDLHAFDKAIVEHFAQGAAHTGRTTPAAARDGSWQRLLAGSVAAATVGLVARQAWRAR